MRSPSDALGRTAQPMLYLNVPYRKLQSGRTIGEALQELRSERIDDPTALSYAYFGDPFARLRFA